MRKYVLFDFADTLVELAPRREVIISKYIFENGNARIDPTIIDRTIKELSVVLPYSSVKINIQEQRKKFYAEFNKAMFIILSVDHLVNSNNLYESFIQNKSHWQLKAGALDTLKTLKRLSYKIGIISNFDSCLNDIVYNHLGLSEFVDYLYVSQTEGFEKPDTNFYLNFFKKYSIPMKNSIYIGDSYHLDFIPANKIGLKTFLIDENNRCLHIKDRVNDISDILKKCSSHFET